MNLVHPGDIGNLVFPVTVSVIVEIHARLLCRTSWKYRESFDRPPPPGRAALATTIGAFSRFTTLVNWSAGVKPKARMAETDAAVDSVLEALGAVDALDTWAPGVGDDEPAAASGAANVIEVAAEASEGSWTRARSPQADQEPQEGLGSGSGLSSTEEVLGTFECG